MERPLLLLPRSVRRGLAAAAPGRESRSDGRLDRLLHHVHVVSIPGRSYCFRRPRRPAPPRPSDTAAAGGLPTPVGKSNGYDSTEGSLSGLSSLCGSGRPRRCCRIGGLRAPAYGRNQTNSYIRDERSIE